MKIDKGKASSLVRSAAAEERIDAEWIERVELLSKLCEEGISKTHIAFLGTAALARAVSATADLYAIKPDHADGNPNAFSARTLCHSVLVPLAAELAFSLGVTGREPLNNQPYFRMRRLDDGTPVHPGGRAAFSYLLELVAELQAADDAEGARALAAFIAVRRRFQRKYAQADGVDAISADALTVAIERFVGAHSESGKRAQAVVAGLMDVFAGPARVESGRINDPML